MRQGAVPHGDELAEVAACSCPVHLDHYIIPAACRQWLELDVLRLIELCPIQLDTIEIRRVELDTSNHS